MTMIGAWLANLALAIGQSAAPPLAAALEPTGKWVVDYEEGMCVLSRRYGEGEAKVEIGFRPVPLADKMQMVLLAQPGKGVGLSGKASIALDDMPPDQGSYVNLSVGSPPQRVTTIFTASDLLDRMATATTLAITTDKITWRLRLRATGSATKALGVCQDQLLARWGLDPAKLHAESAHVTVEGGTSRWFRNDDYPPAALAIYAQGRPVVVMTIDADGKPTNCRVVASAGNADLDNTTCRVGMRRVPFTPAKDRGGSPIASWYVMAIQFVIPVG